MKRPILAVLSAAVLGVLFGTYLPYFCVLIGFVPLLLLKSERDFFKWGFGLCVVFSLFFLRGYQQAQQPAMVIFEPQQLLLRIDNMENPTAYYNRYSARVVEGPLQGQTVFLRLPHDTDFHIGDVIQTTAEATWPDRTQNDGLFSYGDYLQSRGYTAMVTSTGESVRIGIDESPILLARLAFYHKITTSAKALFSSPYQELFISVLTGRTLLDADTKAQFEQLGIAHLLAVSGLHVGILFGLVLFILGQWFHKNTSRVIALVLLMLYAWILGAPPSVLRATIMCGIFVLAKLLRKPHDGLTAWAAAIVIILAIEPQALFNSGFHLSVAGVWSVIWLAPKALLRFHGGSDSKILFSIWVQLGILPLTIFHFGTLSVFSFYINLISIPLFTLLVTLGTPLLLFYGFGPSVIYETAARLVESIGQLFMLLLDALQQTVPWQLKGNLTIAMVIWCYALLILSVKQPFAKMRKDFVKRFIATFAFVWLLSIVLAPKPTTLTMIDIGQGEAMLLQSKSGTFLFDTGGELEQDEYDSYESILAPVLREKGVHRLNGVFVSHFDADHVENLAALLRDFSVDALYFPQGLNGQGADILPTDVDTPIVWLTQGQRMQTEDFSIDVIHDAHFGGNNDSLVLRLTVGDTRVLLTGDIEQAHERRLLQGDVQTDILKVSHHGSAGASSDAFLDAVGAKTAIISAGYRNWYGHPTEDVLTRLQHRGMTHYRTDLQGNITITFYDNGYTVATYPTNQHAIAQMLLSFIGCVPLCWWMKDKGVLDATANISTTITT